MSSARPTAALLWAATTSVSLSAPPRFYHLGIFPLVVFTGANSPTTVDRFPRGEAQHYSEEALRRGVPDSAIFVEAGLDDHAENITMTRDSLARSR